MDDDALRILFASAFTSGMPTDACPGSGVLFDAYHQRLPTDALAEVIDHLAVCAVCAEAWRLARQLDAGPGEAP